MGQTHRYRLDDLRRHAAALGAAAGLAPDRAAALAGHLLWYDTAGFPRLGIARLPDVLDLIGRGEIDPHSEARVSLEHPATAIIDGRNGVPSLALARAAAIAAEKAREVGVGITRVTHVRPLESAAEIAAEVALGPTVAVIVGPRPSWTLAMPTAEGLPLVLDTDLTTTGRADKRGKRPAWVETLAPWSSVLAPDGGYLVLALAVNALEPLTTFHERVASARGEAADLAPGVLQPAVWEAHRREVREQGLPIGADDLTRLKKLAQRLGVDPVG